MCHGRTSPLQQLLPAWAFLLSGEPDLREDRVWLAMTRPALRRQPLSQKMCLQRKSHLGSEEAKVLYSENREQSSSHPPSSLPTLSAKYEALVKSEGHLGDDEKTTGE